VGHHHCFSVWFSGSREFFVRLDQIDSKLILTVSQYERMSLFVDKRSADRTIGLRRTDGSALHGTTRSHCLNPSPTKQSLRLKRAVVRNFVCASLRIDSHSARSLLHGYRSKLLANLLSYWPS